MYHGLHTLQAVYIRTTDSANPVSHVEVSATHHAITKEDMLSQCEDWAFGTKRGDRIGHKHPGNPVFLLPYINDHE
jgi:hypothetical protein